MHWFQTGKGVCQGCIWSSCLFNLYAEYLMGNARLDEAQAAIKISKRSINNKIGWWYHPNSRKWRGIKEPLDEGKRKEWKTGLKLNIQKIKIMVSGPLTSWQINGKSGGFYFLGFQDHCSHKIKRCFLLVRKAMTNLDSVLNSRDITLPTSSI